MRFGTRRTSEEWRTSRRSLERSRLAYSTLVRRIPLLLEMCQNGMFQAVRGVRTGACAPPSRARGPWPSRGRSSRRFRRWRLRAVRGGGRRSRARSAPRARVRSRPRSWRGSGVRRGGLLHRPGTGSSTARGGSCPGPQPSRARSRILDRDDTYTRLEAKSLVSRPITSTTHLCVKISATLPRVCIIRSRSCRRTAPRWRA